jgi:hypothetical protein
MVIINSIRFGSIVVDGKTYDEYENYIVSYDGEITGIHTSQRHLFGKPELEIILKKNPEMIIIGTGDSDLLKVSDEVRSICKQKSIKLVETISKKSIIEFNNNLDKKVVAFIHVTC